MESTTYFSIDKQGSSKGEDMMDVNKSERRRVPVGRTERGAFFGDGDGCEMMASRGRCVGGVVVDIEPRHCKCLTANKDTMVGRFGTEDITDILSFLTTTLHITATTSCVWRYLSFILSVRPLVREGLNLPVVSNAVDQCMTAWSPIGFGMRNNQERFDRTS